MSEAVAGGGGVSGDGGKPVPGSRRAFEPDWLARIGWLAAILYVAYAASLLDFTWARFVTGLDQAARFFDRMFPPDFSRWEAVLKGMKESLEIAVLASVGGIRASIYNAMPLAGVEALRDFMTDFQREHQD